MTPTPRPPEELRALVDEAAARLAEADAADVVAWAATEFGDLLAVACSMADAVLPHLVSRAAPGVDPTLLENYPADLRMIAGDMTVTEPQPTDLVGWTCGTSSRHRSEPPTCPASAPLHAVITFPDCWDGERTDSSDHRAHMANSAGGRCPESHPVHVPQLTFVVAYPVWGDGHELSLASGPTITLHADFMNAWDHEGLGREIELCLHRDVVCGVSSNRGEEPLFAT